MAEPFQILRLFRASENCADDWPDDWVPHGSPVVTRRSVVYRMDSPGSGKSVCVKVIGGGRARENAEKLHAALRHYHARTDYENGYTVPEPYGCVPEHGAVIMKWAEGRACDVIFRLDLFFKNRATVLRRAAGWLRWFHEQSPVKRRPLPRVVRPGDEMKMFGKASRVENAAASHDAELRSHWDVALENAGVLKGKKIECAMLHGDFKPSNILVSSAGVVTGIDFASGKRGPVSRDICRFLGDTDGERLRNPLGRWLARSRASRSGDIEAFLSGYGEPFAKIDRKVFGYLYFLTILGLLAHQRKNFTGNLVSKVRFSIFRRIAREIRRDRFRFFPNGDPSQRGRREEARR